MSVTVQPSLDVARRHVELVTGSPDTPVYVRFLDDTKSGQQAAERYGTLGSLWAEIAEFQRQRYGVFLIPNATARADNFVCDGDVSIIRVSFVDADKVAEPSDWHAPPAFLVHSSPGKWHAYWIIGDVPVAEFEQLQRRLAAKYGTDPKVCNPSRVMRLAGTLHWKTGQPQPVTLEDRTGGRERWETAQTFADMCAGLPEVKAAAAKVAAPTSGELDTAAAIARARALLADLLKRGDVAISGQGGNNRTYQLCCELLNLGLSAEMTCDLLGEIWNPVCQPPWSDDELQEIMDHASRYAQNEPGAWAVQPAAEAFPDAPKFAAAESTTLQPEDDGAPQRIEGEDENEDLDDWPVSAAEYVAATVAPVPELVPGWIEKGITTYLEGPGGTHKSRTGLQDALCLAAGVETFGVRVAKTACLYLNYENPADEMKRRVQQMRKTLRRNNAEPELDVSGAAIWELRDKPRALLIVKRDGEILITRFGRRVMKYLAQRPEHTFVVFDGLMDAIIFEGGTRNEDAVAVRIIKLLDRWCVEYNFSALAIIHPSRAAERQGITGGSYATAWSTKPRAIQSMRRSPRRKGESVPVGQETYERAVVKRSHGPAGAVMTLEYRSGCILPVAAKGNGSPEITAAKLLLDSPLRLRRDGKLGPGRDAKRITNDHWLVEEFRTQTGKDRATVNDLLSAAENARRAGLLGYQEAPSGSHGKRDGASPTGYCAPAPLDVMSEPEGYTDDPTEPEEEAE